MIRYPSGTVRALLSGDRVTAATRDALCDRLARPATVRPMFFDPGAFETLRAVCARLLGPLAGPDGADVAGCIDERLARRRGDGWRYDAMPADGDAYSRGIAGVDATALRGSGKSFISLGEAEQDEVLGAIQRVEVDDADFPGVSPRLFFQDLLAECSERYFSHPLVQEQIGFVGMADARGWQAVGLDALDAIEPRPNRSDGDG